MLHGSVGMNKNVESHPSVQEQSARIRRPGHAFLPLKMGLAFDADAMGFSSVELGVLLRSYEQTRPRGAGDVFVERLQQ